MLYYSHVELLLVSFILTTWIFAMLILLAWSIRRRRGKQK